MSNEQPNEVALHQYTKYNFHEKRKSTIRKALKVNFHTVLLLLLYHQIKEGSKHEMNKTSTLIRIKNI